MTQVKRLSPFFCLLLALGRPSFARAAEEAKPAAPQPIAIREIKRRSTVDFESEVLPIFKANCLACHNQTTTKAELILETPQTIRKGGESGPAVVPGKPNDSLLLQMASHQKRPLMPPKDNKVAASELKPEELGLIKLWIEQGAKGEVRASVPVQWRPLPKTIHPVYAVALTRDGQFAACGRGNRIFIYHLPSRELVAQLADPSLERKASHLDLVQSLDFSPDGTLLASGAFREIKLWRRAMDSKTLPITDVSSNAIFDLAPDSRLLAVTTGTNQISIRDARSNAERRRLTSTEGVSLLKFAQDSTRLAVIEGTVLEIWNVKDGTALAKTNLPATPSQLAWIDPATLAVGSTNIQIWAITNSKPATIAMVNSFAAGDSAITAIAATKESIAFADESGSLRICNLADGKVLHKLKEDAPVTALAISPDGKRFASATSNKVVRLWSSDPKKSVELKGDRYADEAVQAGERMLALAGKEIDFRKSALKTAQTQQSNQLARVEKAGKTNDVVAKAFTEKETKLASAKEARTTAEKGLQELQEKLSKLTNSVAAAAKDDPKEPAEKATTAETSKEATAVTNAPDARLVAEVKQKVKEATEKLTSASNALATAEKEFKKAELTKSIAAHELELGTNSLLKAEQAVTDAKASLTKSEDTEKQKQAALEKFKERAASASSTTLTLAFSPDSQVLASAGDDSAVHTWSAETGAAFDVYRSKAGPLERLTFSGTNGIEAASAKSLFQSSLMPIWRLERTIGKPRPDSPLADRVNAVRFSPDGQLLASGGGEPSRSGEIKLWSVADGKLARDLPGIHSDTVFSLDFSPDGKLLASGAADKFLRVSSVISGKLLKNFEGHTHHVLGVSWKQDGRTLVSAGADGLVKVWNFTTGEKLKNIEGFGKEVTSASFVGITDQLLASAGDGQFKLLRENGETVRSFSGSGEYPYCSAATPDGKVVVAGGLDGVLRVWNGADGKTIAEFAR